MKTMLVVLLFVGLMALLVRAEASFRSIANLIVGLPLILSAAFAIAMLAGLAPIFAGLIPGRAAFALGYLGLSANSIF